MEEITAQAFSPRAGVWLLDAQGDSPAARDALEALFRSHWLPLYAFVRREGHSPGEAQDLTQEFLACLLEHRTFSPDHHDNACGSWVRCQSLSFGAEASSWRPLGLVIVGGLIVSHLITLYITPVIYLALEWFQESVLDRLPFLRSAHSHHEPTRPTRTKNWNRSPRAKRLPFRGAQAARLSMPVARRHHVRSENGGILRKRN